MAFKKIFYEQQRVAKEFGNQLCSGVVEQTRSIAHSVDQSASHRAQKKVRAVHKRTKRSKEFKKSLELAKRHRLVVTSVDYRTEVKSRVICRCQDDEF